MSFANIFYYFYRMCVNVFVLSAEQRQQEIAVTANVFTIFFALQRNQEPKTVADGRLNVFVQQAYMLVTNGVCSRERT